MSTACICTVCSGMFSSNGEESVEKITRRLIKLLYEHELLLP
uniref:Uncharacterized protein n=1 Tax=Rhizophora mucronata TaxID=61149 RepID=A0A2P2N1J8_RHIMU